MTTDSSTNLLPCPFCGNSAVEIIDSGPISKRLGYAVRHACNATNATAGIFCQTSWFEATEAAVELWNKRNKSQ